jgi:hypothetical protein
MSDHQRPGYFTSRYDRRWPHRVAPRLVVDVDQGDDDALIRELRGAIALLTEVNERRRAREAPPDLPPAQTPEQIRQSKLRAMRLGWERRGIPRDERRALAMLAEVAARGIIR